MEFLEKDLEEIIFNAKIGDLQERGLCMPLNRKRQFRIGNYGIADIVGFERPYFHTYFNQHCRGTITIYELKKDKVNISTFMQSIRYLKGIKRYLDKQTKHDFNSDSFNYKIVLIGKSIDMDSSIIYLPDIINNDICDDEIPLKLGSSYLNLELYTYSYELDGLQFKSHYDYSLVKEGF